MKQSGFKTMLAALLMAVALLGGGSAFAASGGFVHKTSSASFDATLASLKHAITGSGMMVLGELDQKRVLSMTGLSLQGAHAFFVGNPVMGKKLFAMNPAVGAVLPLRVYVWVNPEGKTEVGYFKPSELLAAISPMLKMPGAMLDKKFSMILDQATK